MVPSRSWAMTRSNILESHVNRVVTGRNGINSEKV
jgi:hypothetical protein